jgi:hypothetical protein
LEWNEREIEVLSRAFTEISPALKEMALPWPEKILLIKTTGKEEGDVPYTRANAIVIPKSSISSVRTEETKKIARHELCHVLTRQNPDLRDQLYQAIGFEKCGELDFPARLAARKITNPDAPLNNHCIKLEVGGKKVWAMPILYSGVDYDSQRGGDFFKYMRCQFMVVAPGDAPAPERIVYDREKPQLIDMHNISGLFEQVGRNTGYVIHPDEVVADNFALLIEGRRDVPSPEILDRMKAVLESYAAGRKSKK